VRLLIASSVLVKCNFHRYITLLLNALNFPKNYFFSVPIKKEQISEFGTIFTIKFKFILIGINSCSARKVCLVVAAVPIPSKPDCCYPSVSSCTLVRTNDFLSASNTET